VKEIDTIYNRYGKPILRLLENGRFVTFEGLSVGFLDGDNLYNYNGDHVGWYENGIMRDDKGFCVGFGETVTDNMHPFFPFKQFKPFPGFVEFEPFRPFKSLPPFKPLKSFGWSGYDQTELFMGGQDE